MFAMLSRVIQYLLVFIGLLFVGVALFNIRINAGAAATGRGFFQSIEANLYVLLYLFLGFLAWVGAYRIGRGRKKKSQQRTFSDHKG